jgi:hypothetical protein
MGNIIHFPKNNSTKEPCVSTEQVHHIANHLLSSSTEDQAFLELVREWPCFNGMEAKTSLEELLEMYYDDELNISQDCVLEYLFHMHDPKSAFDIANALYSWNEDDRNFFMLSLNMHADLIEVVKK